MNLNVILPHRMEPIRRTTTIPLMEVHPARFLEGRTDVTEGSYDPQRPQDHGYPLRIARFGFSSDIVGGNVTDPRAVRIAVCAPSRAV